MRTFPMTWYFQRFPDRVQREANSCAYCGKAVKRTAKVWSIYVVEGNTQVLHPDEIADFTPRDGNDGLYPVGPECRHYFGEFTRQTSWQEATGLP